MKNILLIILLTFSGYASSKTWVTDRFRVYIPSHLKIRNFELPHLYMAYSHDNKTKWYSEYILISFSQPQFENHEDNKKLFKLWADDHISKFGGKLTEAACNDDCELYTSFIVRDVEGQKYYLYYYVFISEFLNFSTLYESRKEQSRNSNEAKRITSKISKVSI